MPAGILQALLSAVAGIFSAINNVFGAKNTKDMKDRQQQQKEMLLYSGLFVRVLHVLVTYESHHFFQN